MKLLVFDTETTGLPTERKPSIRDTYKWPFILQFSYILYDTLTSEILDIMNDIIYIEDYVNISEKSMEIHKITREVSKNKGISINVALNKFNAVLLKTDLIVAHNLDFDKNLVLVECLRNDIEPNFKINGYNVPEYCTMKNNIHRCKIERINMIGEKYYKYPTLLELYKHIFNIIPNGLHNSMVDVLICLRSFVMLRYEDDVLTKKSISSLFWKYKINTGNHEDNSNNLNNLNNLNNTKH